MSEQFKHGSWGERALGFLTGYFLPQTLDAAGLGYFLYSRSSWYQGATDEMWNALGGASNPANPYSNGGLQGWAKIAAGLLLTKEVKDYRETGKISAGKMNFGIPFELGLLLDGPELNPMAAYHPTAPGGGFGGAGGVTW